MADSAWIILSPLLTAPLSNGYQRISRLRIHTGHKSSLAQVNVALRSERAINNHSNYRKILNVESWFGWTGVEDALGITGDWTGTVSDVLLAETQTLNHIPDLYSNRFEPSDQLGVECIQLWCSEFANFWMRSTKIQTQAPQLTPRKRRGNFGTAFSAFWNKR